MGRLWGLGDWALDLAGFGVLGPRGFAMGFSWRSKAFRALGVPGLPMKLQAILEHDSPDLQNTSSNATELWRSYQKRNRSFNLLRGTCLMNIC